MQRVRAWAEENLEGVGFKEVAQIAANLALLLWMFLLCGFSLWASIGLSLAVFAALLGWAMWAVQRQNEASEHAIYYALRLRDDGHSAASLGICLVWLLAGGVISVEPMLRIALAISCAWSIYSLCHTANDMLTSYEMALFHVLLRLVGIMLALGLAAGVALLLVMKLGPLGILPPALTFGFKPKLVEFYVLGALLVVAICYLNRKLCRVFGRLVAEAEAA